MTRRESLTNRTNDHSVKLLILLLLTAVRKIKDTVGTLRATKLRECEVEQHLASLAGERDGEPLHTNAASRKVNRALPAGLFLGADAGGHSFTSRSSAGKCR
jgi:hypothetical protein